MREFTMVGRRRLVVTDLRLVRSRCSLDAAGGTGLRSKGMKRIPSIKSVMTPFPHSIEIDESLTKASSIMAEHDTRHLIVTDKGKLAGVITDGDIKLALGPGLSTESELLVRDLCVSEVYAVELTAPLDTVLLDMAEKHIGSALVLKEGKLVGIFTTTDACRRFGEFLRTLFPAGGDDAA